jgi:hypothetical protein
MDVSWKSAPRELIIVAKPEVGMRAMGETVTSTTGADVSHLERLITSENIRIQPLFGVPEERLTAERFSLPPEAAEIAPDLSLYYRVDAPDERLDEIAAEFGKHDAVSAAYVKPPTEPAGRAADLSVLLNAVLQTSAPAPTQTPDFTPNQGYLDPAPGGIGAVAAWTRAGGEGQEISIIDVEGDWLFTHEDLLNHQGGIVGGTPANDIHWRNHGTAVAGEIIGNRNSFGITGIAPEAYFRAVSIFGSSSAQAIKNAADKLKLGDIILLELHRPGPRFNFQQRADQRGYIAVEWWEDDLAAVRFAASKGIIVVEAGGNGAENLDDAIYDVNPFFSHLWRNPFRRNPVDSGAIVVGAGAPPPGTHGRNHGPNLSRLDFSNYGALIDAQGWGREVTTTGYGDLQGGQFEILWYTNQFSGTSSASPIVVGAVACVQGMMVAKNRPKLLPPDMRQLLRNTGSPQASAPGLPVTQRIGNRPNLEQIISVLNL